MKTAVLTCIKLENNYIREFVEHYKKLGFTNIIVYDNNDSNTEHIEDVIGDYINSGFVIVEPFYDIKLAQTKAYQDGYNKYGSNYDWIAVFDCDEFLFLNDKYPNIESFLNNDYFSDADIIRVSWRMYTDNDLVRVVNNDYSLVKRFTTPANIQQRWTKAIIRGHIQNITINTGNDGPHLICIPQIKKAVDANGNMVSNLTIRGGCGYENASLNHYSCKTIEEYVLNRKKKGWAVALNTDMLTEKFFYENYQNKETIEKHDLYQKLIAQ